MNPQATPVRRRQALALAGFPLAAALAGALPAAVRAQATAGDWTEAEVRKVDREVGRLTLKHGEIKNLDMPPMTMVFQVRDKALLEGLQAGSRIRFRAAHEKGQYLVLALQPAP